MSIYCQMVKPKNTKWDKIVEQFMERSEKLREAGYSGQGHTSGAESFYGGYFGFGGDKQLAAKPIAAVRKIKKQTDDELTKNSKDRQQKNRGYPSEAGDNPGYSGDYAVAGPVTDLGFFAGDYSVGGGSGGEARIPNNISQIGKSARELDNEYDNDPTKDYWGGLPDDQDTEEANNKKPYNGEEDLVEQAGGSGGGPVRSGASDGNYRDLPGFPRMNALDNKRVFVPPVEGDLDGDGEEDEYLGDEEYVNDTLRLNGLVVKPEKLEKLFYPDGLSESASLPTITLQQAKDAIKKYVNKNNETKIIKIADDLIVSKNKKEFKNLLSPNNHKRARSFIDIKGQNELSKILDKSITLKKGGNQKSNIGEGKMKKTLAKIFFEDATDGSAERYKLGDRNQEPGAKLLINPVDYSGGHAGSPAAKTSNGGMGFGNIITPKDFVPEDWEQRNWKTKEMPVEAENLEKLELGEGVEISIAEQNAAMTSKKLIKKLNKNKDPGCNYIRQKGSHAFYKCGSCSTIVPVHNSKDVKVGTLKAIKKDLKGCLGDDWLDETITRFVKEIFDEAYTGIDDDTGKGSSKGGSKAFEKNREEVLDFDEDQKPQGKKDLKNYHLDEKEEK